MVKLQTFLEDSIFTPIFKILVRTLLPFVVLGLLFFEGGYIDSTVFFCIMGLRLFGKEGSGTPDYSCFQNPSESSVARLFFWHNLHLYLTHINLNTSKQVLWQTAKTQLKCCIRCHFISSPGTGFTRLNCFLIWSVTNGDNFYLPKMRSRRQLVNKLLVEYSKKRSP